MMKLYDEVTVAHEAVQVGHSWAERGDGFAKAYAGSEIRGGELRGFTTVEPSSIQSLQDRLHERVEQPAISMCRS